MKNKLSFPYIPYWPLLAGPTFLRFIGIALNKIVMGLNGGLMPVLMPGGCDPADMQDGTHSCMVAGTHLKFLADWINLHVGIASIGDCLLWAGDLTLYFGVFIWIGLMIADRPENKN